MVQAYSEEDEGNYPLGWMDKRIEDAVISTASSKIEEVLGRCVDRKHPATIKDVTFRENHLQFVVQWPFILPEPVGDSGEYLGTAKDVTLFCRAFEAYVQENDFGWQVTKLLYTALDQSLLRHLKVYRFSGSRLKHGKKLRDPEKFAQALKGRYLSGNRGPRIPESEKNEMRRLAKEVREVVSEIRKKVRAWLKEAGTRRTTLSDEKLRARLRDEYDTDKYPWMRRFSYWFKKMPGSTGLRPTLSDLSSWKPNDLVRAIIKGRLYELKGLEYSQTEIATVTSRQS